MDTKKGKMRTHKKILIFLFVLFVNQLYSQIDTSSTTWIVDNPNNIGGFSATKLTEFPVTVETSQGKSLLFDGVNKALLVKGNPLGSSGAFTIEIVFRPDSASYVTNREQRYLHIRSSANDNRRILMELRILSKMRWTIDTFIKSETSNCTLLDDTTKASFFSHPIGPWYHVALVYENGTMKHFINGIEELAGKVNYTPIENGQISIGARQDPKSWFKGAIRKIKFTRRALAPAEFMKMETTGINEGNSIRNSYGLEQNYPNPFNPSTVISYKLQEPSFVTLKVYDSLGRKITTLVNEYKQPGRYNSQFSVLNSPGGFSGDQLSSGVYFYSLTAENYVQTKKMLFTK